jgi:hypothetical protein
MYKYRIQLILTILAFLSSCSAVRNIKTRKNAKIVLETFKDYCRTKHPGFSSKESDYFLYVSLYKQSDSTENLNLNVQLHNRKSIDTMPEQNIYLFNKTKVLLYEKSVSTIIIKKIMSKVEYEDLKLPNHNVRYFDQMYWDVEFNKKNEIVRCLSGPKTDTTSYLLLEKKGIKLSKSFRNKN